MVLWTIVGAVVGFMAGDDNRTNKKLMSLTLALVGLAFGLIGVVGGALAIKKYNEEQSMKATIIITSIIYIIWFVALIFFIL